MLEEFLVLVYECFYENLSVLWDGEVTLENLCAELCQELLTMNNIVNIFIILACFSY
jgi:hypothetical protein